MFGFGYGYTNLSPRGGAPVEVGGVTITSSPGGMTIVSSPEMGSSFTTTPSSGSIGVS